MKSILIITAALLLSFSSQATHLMGGQVTSRNLGGLNYEITMTVYRDTVGVPISTIAIFNIADTSGSWTFEDTVYVSPAAVFGNGVEEYSYVTVVTFPATGAYTIWSESCCRNCILANMTNPCGESFHLYNELYVDASNSSPVFINPPIVIGQLLVPFSYNPLPFDTDGDSMTWQIDTPLTAGGNYVAGYVIPPSDPLTPFTVDPQTGQITFLPNTQGYFEVSFLVNEFRNGIKIGAIRRDMQIIIIPSPNLPPTFTSTCNTSPYTGNSFTVLPGSNFELNVEIVDPNSNLVSIVAAGEPLMLSSNPASYLPSAGMGTASGIFSWTPDLTQVRTAPYLFTMRITDNYGTNMFVTDVTFSVEVPLITLVNDFKNESGIRVYPNPAHDHINLEFTALKEQAGVIAISNMAGQKVYKELSCNLRKGNNLISLKDISLESGNYFLTLTAADNSVYTASFTVK